MLAPEPQEDYRGLTTPGSGGITAGVGGDGHASPAEFSVVSAPVTPVSPAPSVTVAKPHPASKYKMHWHVLLTHFPISFFMVSSLFMLLHFMANVPCLETAASVALLAGTLMMIPSTITGWKTWKRSYRGHKLKLFQIKINTAFVMIGLSFTMLTWRAVAGGLSQTLIQYNHPMWHVGLLIGTTLLILGAVVEGYYGGKLNHR